MSKPEPLHVVMAVVKDPTSHIDAHASGTTFVGKDAVDLFAATAVVGALRLYIKTGMKVNRAYTPSAMVLFATAKTGRVYKRNKQGYAEAAYDLGLWIEAMKALIPVVQS